MHAEPRGLRRRYRVGIHRARHHRLGERHRASVYRGLPRPTHRRAHVLCLIHVLAFSNELIDALVVWKFIFSRIFFLHDHFCTIVCAPWRLFTDTRLFQKPRIDGRSSKGFIPDKFVGNLEFRDVTFAFPCRPDYKVRIACVTGVLRPTRCHICPTLS